MWDIYDIFLQSIGYGNPRFYIPDSILIQNEEALAKLSIEIGLEIDHEEFELFLTNDDENDMIEAVLAIYELGNQFELGYGNEESMVLMQEAHFLGKAKLASGSYKKMNQMKLVLNEKGFYAFIRKIEK